MRRLGILVGAVVALATVATPNAHAWRLQGLDGIDALFSAGPGRMLAGDRVVYAAPGGVYAWPVTGGRPRRIAALPKLGDAENDLTEGGGFVRVEAAQPDRIVVARGGNSALDPTFEAGAGHQLVVGPPEGPFADPASCEEATGLPADLDGDHLAYYAVPSPMTSCDTRTGVPGPSVVVRSLATPTVPVPVRILPLAEREAHVSAVQIAGDFVAYAGSRERDPDRAYDRDPREALVVVDLRTGAEVLRLPRIRNRAWALDRDGTVVAGRLRIARRGPCLAGITDLRSHGPGDAVGVPVRTTACGLGTLSLRDGTLRHSTPRPDGRLAVVDLNLTTGATRTLAVTSGGAVDADDEHVIAIDDTCTTTTLRVMRIDPTLTRQPTGSRGCPVTVAAPRSVPTAGKHRFSMRIRCPLGCLASVGTRTRKPGTDVTYGSDFTLRVRPGARRVKLRVPFLPRRRPAIMDLTVAVRNPVGGPTSIRRSIGLRVPAK